MPNNNTREKWKRGFRKLTKKDSTLSAVSTGSVIEEETTDMEVAAYLANLKNKTGIKNIWSGNKFQDIVDDDRTPDISSDSDEELNMKMSMNMSDFNKLRLDSDEDEMRIDFLRESRDENNNDIKSSSSDSMNLMNNLHFAQLELADVKLSDNEIEKEDDFFPKVYTLDGKNNEKSESSTSSSKHFGEINLMDSVEEYISVNTEHDGEIKSPLNAFSVASSVDTKQSVASSGDTQQSVASSVDTQQSKSSHSHDSSKSKRKSRKLASRSIRSSNLHSSDKANQNSSDTLSATSSIVSDASSIDLKSGYSSTNNSNGMMSSKSSLQKSRSSKSYPSRKSHSSSNKHKRFVSSKEYETKKLSSHAETQTGNFKLEDKTKEVHDYLHSWQLPKSSNITQHAIDPLTIETLTSYNPSVLAANDMLKYHLHLMQKHIVNSRRLYESYAHEDINNNYVYTSVEDTMKFIKQNRPEVISYADALNEIKASDYC